jgi:hypothetical protein
LLAIAGCTRDNPTTQPAPEPVASKVKHHDRLAPGELSPGKDTAFGLTLPSQLKVMRREPFLVQCEGRVQPERVSNYLRSRVDAQSVDVGSVKTIFDHAVVRGTLAPVLRIEVVKTERGSRMTVEDLSPQKIPLLSPEDAWKAHGFDGEGKRMDPSKFE